MAKKNLFETRRAKGGAAYRIILRNLKPVAIQNTVNLVNIVFFIVSMLLLALGEVHESLFLGGVLVLNIVIGIVQDLRAKVALEKLQVFTAPRIIRATLNGTEESILLNDIAKGDLLKISLGDQVPADGEVASSNGLEINEALITGESNYVRKAAGERVLAGSIVVAGSAMMRVLELPKDSYVSKMTAKIKKYKSNPSPIQRTLNTFIRYMSYLLVIIIIYVIVHGIRVNDLFVSMVKDIGALTGTLVPQGLILATTIFFVYGAVRLLKENVLMQEINATEKLARIRNLCVDKTGTLTSCKPVLEETIIYGAADVEIIRQLVAGYIQATGDTSEIVKALRAQSAAVNFSGSVIDSMPFSSARKYGTSRLKIGNRVLAIVMGAPDILAARVPADAVRQVLREQIAGFSQKARRLILLAEFEQSEAGETTVENGALRPLALFVFADPLRQGTKDIIRFFQENDVRVRVISGDDPQTVQAVANQAGMKYTDMVVTGKEMESWDDIEYEERVPAFHLFARTSPAQKEKIISLLKKSGFTAMVGDGANDALALKKADLGIAMFDGAPATRQIAQVVLMNNSFAALPRGITLAQILITNIELVASIFLNKVVVGLVLFTGLAFFGHSYPLTPSSTTIINYFTVWLPMAYWAFSPVSDNDFDAKAPFMKRSWLFSLISGIIMAAAAIAVYLLAPIITKGSDPHILVVITLIALGYWFFVLAPLNYGAAPAKKQRLILGFLAGISAIALAAAIYKPSLSKFFELGHPALLPFLTTAAIVGLFGYFQYYVAVRWFYRRAR